MKILPKRPTTKAPSDHFVGDAWIDRITDAEPPSRIRVNFVRFAPGTRNAWHAHPSGQTLHVTEGVGRVQSRDGEVLEIRPGETVVTPPGEWHWHGAAPDRFMTHLAIWEALDGREDPEWGELVSDEEYAEPARTTPQS
jgi:quercetin dioxygenase-like cupin family protein